jgi:hypothetical protein
VTRVWRATFKPAGTALLVEVADSSIRSTVENQLRKRGAGWWDDEWVFSVEGPDDETLDALENRMREKFGWDRNRPRSIGLLHARIRPEDLPEGLTLANEKIDGSSFSCELRGPQLTLQVKIVHTHNYGKIDQAKKENPYKPGDILLDKDTVVVWIGGGGEASWPVLEKLEAILRKKMRMDGPALEEFEIPTWQLPEGSTYLRGGNKGNPRALKGSVPGVANAWEADVDPSETQVQLYQLPDANKAATFAESRRRELADAGNKTAVLTRGAFAAVLWQRKAKTDDAALGALSEILRCKFRLAK